MAAIKEDKVNSPKHYTSHPSGIECIEVTRWYDFCIGNAIKYLWRAGLKSEKGYSDVDKQIEDLKKAVWYINDEIKSLEEKKKIENLHFDILVFGGSFDPPHIGHLSVLESVVSKGISDKVVIVPARVSPFKEECDIKYTFAQRVALVEAMIDSSDLLKKAREEEKLEVSLIENTEEFKDSPSYTYKTLKKLQSQNPGKKISFLVGEDVAYTINKFYKAEDLLEEFTCLVYYRPSDEDNRSKKIDKRCKILGKDFCNEVIMMSSTKVRKAVKEASSYEDLEKTVKPMLPKEVFKLCSSKIIASQEA